MSKTPIKIDIVSDVVCPWCYIGKRRLEKAMNEVADDFEFTVDFVPFELNQGSQNSDVHIHDYLAQKYGYTPEQVEDMSNRVVAVAAQEGIEMNFEDVNFTANTLMAHQLIESVKDLKEKAEIKEALLKAYFTDNVHVGIKDNLIEVAKQNNVRDEYLTEFINTPNTEQVEAKQAHYKSMGINAVPSFIINDQYLVQGAQEAQTFINTFKSIANESN